MIECNVESKKKIILTHSNEFVYKNGRKTINWSIFWFLPCFVEKIPKNTEKNECFKYSKHFVASIFVLFSSWKLKNAYNYFKINLNKRSTPLLLFLFSQWVYTFRLIYSFSCFQPSEWKLYSCFCFHNTCKMLFTSLLYFSSVFVGLKAPLLCGVCVCVCVVCLSLSNFLVHSMWLPNVSIEHRHIFVVLFQITVFNWSMILIWKSFDFTPEQRTRTKKKQKRIKQTTETILYQLVLYGVYIVWSVLLKYGPDCQFKLHLGQTKRCTHNAFN